MMSDSFPFSNPASSSAPAPLPIWIGIRSAAEEMPWGQERTDLLQIAERLQHGSAPLHTATKMSARRTALAATLQSALESGRFAQVMEEYLRTSRNLRRLRWSFWLSLIYPFAMLILATIVLAVFLLLVSQQMKNILIGFGVELPALTVFMITVSDFLGAYWVAGLCLLAGLAALPFCLHWLPGKEFRTRVLRSIPLVGSASKNAAAAEFCARLAVLIDARLPLPRALEMLSMSLRDALMRTASRHMAERVNAGTDAAIAAEEEQDLPPQLVSPFRWTQSPDAFADGLRVQSELFATQARLRADQLRFFIEPLTFLVVGCAGGLVIISFFMPLIKLLNDLA
ncbi:type II secretion system F family protein [Planctomicrobium piriforme]|uniref:Type II secretory pathway, component PulF n=1 Tax=Planctomicrobium piriforme TaxID=1576369 RepID=A0A1I3FEZ2_9PLAN|nr:type II secretion system F family protein [Planctomicrobium piriforme]SFI09760.1 Type II secretory pathway, component PulF [Planctomicrobium piriforme]